MDIIVTILSYIAVWFIGACSLAAVLCALIHHGEVQKREQAAALKARLDNTEDPTPKSGPILIYKD